MIAEAELIQAIRDRAAETPDHVNRTELYCTYLPSLANLCGCLVGEAMLALEVPWELLVIIDGWGPQGIKVGWGTDPVIDLLKDLFTAEALRSPWVIEAQVAQDTGLSWAQAVDHADRGARR